MREALTVVIVVGRFHHIRVGEDAISDLALLGILLFDSPVRTIDDSTVTQLPWSLGVTQDELCPGVRGMRIVILRVTLPIERKRHEERVDASGAVR